MALMDAQNLFSDEQAITVTTASTNLIDLSQQRELGGALTKMMDLFVSVNTTFTAAGAATLVIAVETSTDNSTYNVAMQTDPIPVASLVAGAAALITKFPHAALGDEPPRYLRLGYTVATGPFTAGALSAGLIVGGVEQWYAYRRNFTVSVN